ncbi:MAG: bacteriohopanetetrol glucosamine biosynthesis glycosyltransferase HpnI [Candidatus Sulfotelmatobacter sp.]
MIHSILRLVQLGAAFGAACSSAYYLLCLWSASAFLRQRRVAGEGSFPAQALPPVSVLKPLKGTDPEIYQSFRSHCLQDYLEYEIIFGVSDPHDPAVASVRQLQSEFPALSIRLIVCDKTLGANVKVSNLAQMLAEARYQYLLVNDSDIRVEADYLRRVMMPLANPEVGMVTCLYRGVAAATLGSRIESLGISTDFCAGVLAARQLEGGLKFGLGSTMAFRRGELEKIGGFESFADYLADDYELGRRIAHLGLEVELSDVVVETNLPAYRAPEFLSHQLRWARGVRDSRSGGYFGLVLTYGLLWSCAVVAASSGARWAWALAGTTLFLRTAVALVVGKSVLCDRQLLRQLWLLPLRDLVAVGVWVASLAGHTVSWRGDRFELKNGKLIRIVS